jgi:excisionase family DNA binding protein
MNEPHITLRLDDRLAYPIDEAARIIGLSRATIYRSMADVTLAWTQVRGRRLVLRDDLLALLNGGRNDLPA